MISSFDLSTSLAHGPGSSGSVDNIDCSFLHGVQVWEGQNRPFTIDDDLEKSGMKWRERDVSNSCKLRRLRMLPK